MDDLGNRKGMDFSFRLIEGATADGVSYVSGKEAARYDSASETVQVRGLRAWLWTGWGCAVEVFFSCGTAWASQRSSMEE